MMRSVGIGSSFGVILSIAVEPAKAHKAPATC